MTNIFILYLYEYSRVTEQEIMKRIFFPQGEKLK